MMAMMICQSSNTPGKAVKVAEEFYSAYSAAGGVSGRAGETIDQGHAVKEDTRRQRAKDEVFQAGFGRAHGIPVEGGQDIG